MIFNHYFCNGQFQNVVVEGFYDDASEKKIKSKADQLDGIKSLMDGFSSGRADKQKGYADFMDGLDKAIIHPPPMPKSPYKPEKVDTSVMTKDEIKQYEETVKAATAAIPKTDSNILIQSAFESYKLAKQSLDNDVKRLKSDVMKDLKDLNKYAFEIWYNDKGIDDYGGWAGITQLERDIGISKQKYIDHAIAASNANTEYEKNNYLYWANRFKNEMIERSNHYMEWYYPIKPTVSNVLFQSAIYMANYSNILLNDVPLLYQDLNVFKTFLDTNFG